MVDDYRPTHFLGLCMPSDAQQLYGMATLRSFPLLRHALPLCFVLCLSALPPSSPSAFVFCSPPGIPLSFCISLSPSVSLHPVSFSSSPPPAPFVSRSNPQFIYSPLFYFTALKSVCVCVSLSLQWSYGFYLTHNQGQSGFEFFFKTKELKKKWVEQFGMAMWVCFVGECVTSCVTVW